MEMIHKAQRYAAIKHQNNESFQLKILKEKHENTGLSFYDYLDGLVVIHYLLRKKSFSNLFI